MSLNKEQHQQFIVSKQASGERLQQFLQKKLSGLYSGKKIKTLIDRYGCYVNGKIELFSSYKVTVGDMVTVNLSKLVSIPSEDNKIKIVYEDEDFLICVKPAHVASDKETLSKRLAREELFLVHRLDKETTGLLLIAKNEKMQSLLENLFKKREIKKVYHAIVQGFDRHTTFTVDNHLGKKCQYEGQSLWGSASKEEGGLRATTLFKVLKKTAKHMLVECSPHTGRTHQIRVHLAEKGLPIIGDNHYARATVFIYQTKRLLLHAYSLSFLHPKTKQPLTIVAPYPQDFKEASNKLFSHEG